MSEQAQFSYRNGIICGVMTPNDNLWNNKSPLQKPWKILVDPREHLNFALKRIYHAVLLRELSSALKANLSLEEYQEDEFKSLIKAQWWPFFKVPEWLIVAIKEYLFVKETSTSIVMGTTRCLFDSLCVQLKKFASLISWPP